MKNHLLHLCLLLLMKMIQRSFNSSLSLPLSEFLRSLTASRGREKEPGFGLVCSSVCPRQLKPRCLVPLWQWELIYMKGCSENGRGSTQEKAHRWVSSSVCEARAQHSSVKFTTLLQNLGLPVSFTLLDSGLGKKKKKKRIKALGTLSLLWFSSVSAFAGERVSQPTAF